MDEVSHCKDRTTIGHCVFVACVNWFVHFHVYKPIPHCFIVIIFLTELRNALICLVHLFFTSQFAD